MTSTETPSVADMARLAEVDPPALELAGDDQEPKAYVDRLAAEGMHLDAIRFLAHVLPLRSAVWWAWGCARQAAGEPIPDTVKTCIETTQAWLAEPTDARRKAAGDAANAIRSPDAATLAAMAAFMSSGGVGATGAPEPGPPPDVTAKLAAGAVSLAALAGDPEEIDARADLYLKQGMEVARKSGVWPAAPGKE